LIQVDGGTPLPEGSRFAEVTAGGSVREVRIRQGFCGLRGGGWGVPPYRDADNFSIPKLT